MGDYSGDFTVIGNSSQFFTLGGIIVREINIPLFTTELQEIRRGHFSDMKLPEDFKLHYFELREKRISFNNIKYPYDSLSREEKFQICNRVFDAIVDIECNLLSVTLDLDKHCKNYAIPVDPMAYTIYLMLERFQYFLEDHNSVGVAIYEKFNSKLQKKVELVHKMFLNNPNFPKPTDFTRILGNVRNGNPVNHPILQFADFFAYSPWIKCTRGRTRRYDQIKHKYYNFNYRFLRKRGNYEI